MRDTELKQQMGRCLYETYKAARQERSFSSLRDAAAFVCRQGARCWFISAEEANVRIGMILQRRSLLDLGQEKRRKIWAIYERFREYMSLHPGTDEPRLYILERIVDSPAPEFFLSPERTRKILSAERFRERRERRW